MPAAPPNNPPRVVAVMPAYQLERSIGEIVRRARAHADLVIVPADGTRDGTAQAARDAGALVPEPENVRGKGYALRKGIRAALESGAQIVVMLDADGQHLPEEIPALVAPIAEGRAELVSGSRFLGTLRTSRINRFGNHVLRLLSFVLTRRWLTDTETGFRAFRRGVLEQLELTSNGYEIESEIMMRALHLRVPLVEVPIHVPLAVPGATWRDGLRVAAYKVKLAWQLARAQKRASAPRTTHAASR